MNETELKEGFVVLKQLALDEYEESLRKVTSNEDKQMIFNQVGRLVGVTLKQPFAEPMELTAPSPYSHAYRSWALVDEKTFEERQEAQGQALKALLEELKRQGEAGDNWTLYQLALDAHHERGFFGYLARSCRKYICNDPEFRKEVEKAVNETRKAGVDLKYMIPDVIVGSGGLSLGVWLVGAVPVLSVMGAPVIAGLVLLLYKIGADAFCEYSNSSSLGPVEAK